MRKFTDEDKTKIDAALRKILIADDEINSILDKFLDSEQHLQANKQLRSYLMGIERRKMRLGGNGCDYGHLILQIEDIFTHYNSEVEKNEN